MLPGLSDGHVHLDKCLLGLPWRPHRATGTVRAKIEDEKAFRRENRIPLAEQGAEALLTRMLRGGTTSLRTHVDIDDVTGLDHLAQILALRERWSGRMQIQVVAFPQSGILSCPPVAGTLDEAMRMGADCVGGLDPIGSTGTRRHRWISSSPWPSVTIAASTSTSTMGARRACRRSTPSSPARRRRGSAAGSRSATPSPSPTPTTGGSDASPGRWQRRM